MPAWIVSALLAFAVAPSRVVGPDGADAARALINQSLSAMGGADKVRSIRRVEADQVGHSYALEQSERPEGPWLCTYITGESSVDFDASSVKFRGHLNGLLYPSGQDISVESKPGKTVASLLFLGTTDRQRLALGPERLLLRALAGKDLRLGKPTRFHDIPHDVIEFRWGPVPVRILLNRYTHLPAAVDIVHQGRGYWWVWGDVTERVIWGNWDIVSGGLHYPTLWSVERNGYRQEDDTLTKVKVSFRAPDAKIDEDLSRVEPYKPGPLPKPPFHAAEIAHGIVQYQGAFNCAAVDQEDGVVVLEGVVSSSYMSEVLKDVARRFPGKPVKAVITSDDAWPHVGGLRLFVARKVPIIALKANEPILRRLFRAPFSIVPDELALHPSSPRLELLDGKFELGAGENRLVIYPMHGAVSERMLYVYLPGKNLLYAPDVIQYAQGEWFNVNLLDEMLTALSRDGIHPDSAFAFHSGLIGVADLRKAVSAAQHRD
jgi:hypothetical protein